MNFIENAPTYLALIQLLAKYPSAKSKLLFVIDWLYTNKNTNGKWDMGNIVNDKVYFPLSDSWRQKSTREADFTYRIERLIKEGSI